MCKYSYDLIEGLNILDIMLCVHYEEKNEEKKQMFLENIKQKDILGISLDNRVALVVHEDRYEIVKDDETKELSKIELIDGEIKIKKI